MPSQAGSTKSFILSSSWKSEKAVQSLVKLLGFSKVKEKDVYQKLSKCFLYLQIQNALENLEEEMPVALWVRNRNVRWLTNSFQCSDLCDTKKCKHLEKTLQSKCHHGLQSRAKAMAYPRATVSEH